MNEQQKPRKKKKHILRRILLILLLLVLAAVGILYAYTALRNKYTVAYTAYQANRGSISNSLSFSGNIQLINQKNYQSSSSATVKTVYVKEQQIVSEGDKLIRLSNGETVKADFNGTVNTISVSEGNEVTQGDNLVQLADFSRMRVSVRVDEYDISDVSVGTPCTVTVTANEKVYFSEIASIDYISASGGNVAYYTAVLYVEPEAGVYPGMQVTVSVPKEEANDVTVLKVDALSFDERNQAFVYVESENGSMEMRYVTTGVSNGNYIEICDGIEAGDTVYSQTEVETDSAVDGFFARIFGGTRIAGGRMRGDSISRNMNDFDFGNMPSGGFGGNMPSGGFDRSSFGGFGSGQGGNQGGNRPSFGGS